MLDAAEPRPMKDSGDNPWRRRLRRAVWGRRGGPTRRLATVTTLLGLVIAALGALITIFGPPSISATAYHQLLECPGDPVPNDGSCYSLAQGHLVGVGTPDGYLYVQVDDATGHHEEQILDASLDKAFAGGGDVTLKYWHNLLVAIQVPGISTLASTFRNPVDSLNWGLYGRVLTVAGVAWLAVAMVFRRRSLVIDRSRGD